MKDKSKIRTNWLRQERNSKGHFMPYKKDYREKSEGEFIEESAVIEPESWESLQKKQKEKYSESDKFKPDWVNYRQGKEDGMKEAEDKFIDFIEHAFYAGLKANNSFYPPSKLWEFYKRDRGLG